MALLREKKYDDAAKNLRQAVQTAPKHRPSYDALLEIFTITKQNYESRMLLGEMVKNFGPKKEFAHALCKLYSIDSFFKEAQDACKTAISLDPKYPDTHVYLAQTYYNQDNKKMADRILKNAGRTFPNSEFVQYAAGEYYLNEKNYSASLRYLEAAVRINPSALRAQITYGIALFESRQYEKALQHFDKACKLDKSKDTLTAIRNSAAKLRQSMQTAIAEQYDRKAAVCQQI
jgi:tetratricopeptide (TPR) repeat protein